MQKKWTYWLSISCPVLCLEQVQQSLEDHTRGFLHLACLPSFTDHSLCIFYLTSLNERTKARLPGNGPRGTYLKWVLVNYGSHSPCALLRMTSGDDNPDPEPSQPPPTHCTELTPEPTAMHEPDKRTSEHEPYRESDQVHETATLCVPVSLSHLLCP